MVVVAALVVTAVVVEALVVVPVELLVAEAVAPPAEPLDGDVFGFVSLGSQATRASTTTRDADTTSPTVRGFITQCSSTSATDANNRDVGDEPLGSPPTRNVLPGEPFLH